MGLDFELLIIGCRTIIFFLNIRKNFKWVSQSNIKKTAFQINESRLWSIKQNL